MQQDTKNPPQGRWRLCAGALVRPRAMFAVPPEHHWNNHHEHHDEQHNEDQCSLSSLSYPHNHHEEQHNHNEEQHNDDHDHDNDEDDDDDDDDDDNDHDHDNDDHDGDTWNTVDLSVGASVKALFSFFFLNLLINTDKVVTSADKNICGSSSTSKGFRVHK